jgi:TorA maturation chaperone TorD
VPELERGLVMGRSTVDARRRYAEAGLQLSPDFTDLPDHIAVELEFMYFLCDKEAEAWQAQDEETALERRAAEHAFLGAHLSKWIPSFCQTVVQAAQEEFYQGLARLTQAWVEGECNRLNVLASLAVGGAASVK